MSSLESNQYKFVLQGAHDGVSKPAKLSTEASALIDYYLALRSHQFVGNSVSVFSALLILERWHAGRYASYYNGGNIPLEALLPLYPFPWVFTYNDWSAGTEYDYMAKAAVTSAIDVARMKAFCMYSGSKDSPMYLWFVSRGVTIIQHDPTWKAALIKEGRRFRQEYSQLYSHLYKTDGALVGAFQRIDIPILHEFDQYNYILFTDCDVYFRKQMKLFDWGTPLPTALGLGFENEDKFPYNDGVMLWNMPYMRQTNAGFVAWILNQTNGLYFTGYGPVDQGAFNQYYEKEIKGKPVNKNFNAKMYHELRKSARIVHFHGPKPNHYLQYFLTQKCATFQDMCKNGVEKGGLCPYAIEYGRLAPYWGAARRLGELCINMKEGTFHFAWEDPANMPCQQVSPQVKPKPQGNKTNNATALQPPASTSTGAVGGTSGSSSRSTSGRVGDSGSSGGVASGISSSGISSGGDAGTGSMAGAASGGSGGLDSAAVAADLTAGVGTATTGLDAAAVSSDAGAATAAAAGSSTGDATAAASGARSGAAGLVDSSSSSDVVHSGAPADIAGTGTAGGQAPLASAALLAAGTQPDTDAHGGAAGSAAGSAATSGAGGVSSSSNSGGEVGEGASSTASSAGSSSFADGSFADGIIQAADLQQAADSQQAANLQQAADPQQAADSQQAADPQRLRQRPLPQPKKSVVLVQPLVEATIDVSKLLTRTGPQEGVEQT